MARPKKRRCCRRYNADRIYKPRGIPMTEVETTLLSLDQFEALRLCDYERLEQEEAGQQMGVSRGTIQRLLYSARQQLVDAILNNKAIIVNLKESETCDAGMHSHERQRRSYGHSE